MIPGTVPGVIPGTVPGVIPGTVPGVIPGRWYWQLGMVFGMTLCQRRACGMSCRMSPGQEPGF